MCAIKKEIPKFYCQTGKFESNKKNTTTVYCYFRKFKNGLLYVRLLFECEKC